MKTLKILMTAVFIIVLTACQHKKVEEKTIKNQTDLSLTNQQIQFNGIQFSTLEQREFSMEIHAYGKVEVPPQNKSIITAKFGGFVKSISILDGMKVKKGQKLIAIEDPAIIQMQQDYLENKSDLEFLKAEFERQQTLSKEEATSLKSFQQAKSNYLSAKARNLGLKNKLKLAGVSLANINENSLQNIVSLRAPFDGIVTKVNVEMGVYVNPQDKLLEIIDTKHAHAEISVYEKDIYKIETAQAVGMIFPNLDEQIFGKIYMIGHDINPDKTVKVHCHFNEEQTQLIPGSFFKATIKTKPETHYSLPKEAVIHNKGKNFIFALKEKKGGNSTFEVITVKILTENDQYVAVSMENINQYSSKEFVVKGAYELFGKMEEN